jgi:hypothetical protein
MVWFSKNSFERTSALLERTTRFSAATFGSFVKRLTPVEGQDRFDWAGDADWARLQQERQNAAASSCLCLAAAAALG